jgi:LysM repeat protein
MRLRSLCCAGAALAAVVVPADSLFAAPPSAAARMVAAVATPSTFWVTHEVVAGERLSEIAARYAVSPLSILRWNKLDPNRPQFWAGEQLRIQTTLPDRVRHKLSYLVRPYDSWEKIAQRFGVDRNALEHFWNPQEQPLLPGHQLTVWVESGSVEHPADPDPEFPLVEVPPGGHSVGYPDRGRLVDGVQIPPNPTLYSIRNLDHAYGSTHAIRVMQRSIAEFRTKTGYDRPVVIWDMSQKKGGHFGPHHSHRTGRDVDIALLLRPGFEPGTTAKGAVDWEAIWHLVRAFVASGEVKYVFLSRPQQFGLYKAAKACGATSEELDAILQFPRTTKVGIVRHSPGHTGHIHVRFTCGADEVGCEEI